MRGTTSRKLVQLLRTAGAKEVHMRISAPPVISPCYYGIDMPTKNELIAAEHSVEEVKNFVTADSVAYLGTKELRRAIDLQRRQFLRGVLLREVPGRADRPRTTRHTAVISRIRRSTEHRFHARP